jgi:transposase
VDTQLPSKEIAMAGPHKSKRKYYAPEFKERMVELMRTGRPATQLSKEFGVSVSTLTSWLWRAKVEAGEVEGLTMDERAELAKLRREVATLREEKEILKNSRPGPPRNRTGTRGSVPIRRGEPGSARGSADVSNVGRDAERLLRLVWSRALGAHEVGC